MPKIVCYMYNCTVYTSAIARHNVNDRGDFC